MRNFRIRTTKGPAIYFLAAPTRDHMPIFGLPALAKQAVKQLARATADANAVVAGYVVMPSSMMAIVAFRGDHDLGEFMYNYKRLSALAIVGLDHGEFHEMLYRKDKFRPWMGRFDRMVIGSKEQLISRLDYIHNEPVRRGLAASATEYSFSSAGDWAGTARGLIKIEKDLAWAGIG
jgi:hypothetical protein